MQHLFCLPGIRQLNGIHQIIFFMYRIAQVEIMVPGVDVFVLDDNAFAQRYPVFEGFEAFPVSNRHFIEGMEGQAQPDAGLQFQIVVDGLLQRFG
ncbi:hypothetical protein D3C73_917720 [compost metagenome]